YHGVPRRQRIGHRVPHHVRLREPVEQQQRRPLAAHARVDDPARRLDVPLLEAREAHRAIQSASTRLGTHIDHASVTRSSISAWSISASRTTSQLYRRSEVLGRTNFSGSASSAASRKSLGKPNPIIVSSRAIATNTI